MTRRFGASGSVWLVGICRTAILLVTRSADETIMLCHVGLSELVAIACSTGGRQHTVKDVSEIVGEEITPALRRPAEGTGRSVVQAI